MKELAEQEVFSTSNDSVTKSTTLLCYAVAGKSGNASPS